MSMRMQAGLGALALGAAAMLALAPGALAKETHFRFAMNGKLETPPNDSAGHGLGTAVYDDQTHDFTWNISYENLTGPATAAHFHGPAKPGQAAPPVVPIKAPGGIMSPIVGSVTLSDDQAKQLLGNLWYFNVHTAANKAGEIRGEVRRAPMMMRKPAPAPEAAPEAAPASMPESMPMNPPPAAPPPAAPKSGMAPAAPPAAAAPPPAAPPAANP